MLGSWGGKFRVKIVRYTAETWKHPSSRAQESCFGIRIIVIGKRPKNGANAVEIPLHWWRYTSLLILRTNSEETCI